MIDSLKRQLGAGARTNKYLLEISYGELNSEKLNVLCKAASLPENKINTVTVAYHGREVQMRSTTEYAKTYEITIYDDASLSLRKFFDTWLLAIDDPGRYKTKLTDGTGGSGGFLNNIIKNVDNVIDTVKDNINDIKDLPNRVSETVSNWFYGYTGLANPAAGMMHFATPMKIWQLDNNNNKVYGYEFENVFPTAIGSVQYGADKQNEVVEYTVTFAYSAFNVA